MISSTIAKCVSSLEKDQIIKMCWICLPRSQIYNVMLKNTATTCTSQSLKCHIRIPDPLVELQSKNLLQVISHAEAFSSLSFSLHSSLFLFWMFPLPLSFLQVLVCVWVPPSSENQRVLVTEVLELPSSFRTVLDFSSYLRMSVPASPHLSDRFSQRLLSKHVLSILWSHTQTHTPTHTWGKKAIEWTHTYPSQFTHYPRPTNTHLCRHRFLIAKWNQDRLNQPVFMVRHTW